MKSLLFSSLLFILALTGCISVKPERLTVTDQLLFQEKSHAALSENALFKATLEIKKHRLTGLMLIKRMSSIDDTNLFSEKRIRIVFTNEIGLKFFDLEFSKDSMKVISCFSSLDRKGLLNILKTDFQILTDMREMKPLKYYCQESSDQLVVYGKAGKVHLWKMYSKDMETLVGLSGKSTFADHVNISFLNYKEGFPSIITLKNPVIGLSLSLRRLK